VIKQVVLVQPPQAGLLDGFASGLIDLANFIAPKVPETDITILDLGLEPNTVVSSKLRSALKKAEELRRFREVTHLRSPRMTHLTFSDSRCPA